MADDLIISNTKMADVAAALNVTPQQLLQQFIPNADLVGQVFAFVEANGVTTPARVEEAFHGIDPTLIDWALQLYVLGGQGVRIPRP